MRFHARAYSVKDFKKLADQKLLVLSPKFQRRKVWQRNAQSYFLDTLVRELPSPKIYLRERTQGRKKNLIREVVDGQQRLNAVLELLRDEIRIRPQDNLDVGGKPFSEWERVFRDGFLSYQFSVDILTDANDNDVLDMFARLNQYSYRLTKQELRNATYHGEFKSSVYRLARTNIGFFRSKGVLSERSIIRMADAELVSELVVAMLDGLQDKKKSLNQFYKENDRVFPQERRCEKRFAEVIDDLDRVFGEVLESSSFRKRSLFYSLFCCMYDLAYGLPRQHGPYGRIPNAQISRAQDKVALLSQQIESPTPDVEYAPFVMACKRQTDNLNPRQERHNTILRELRPLIGGQPPTSG
jgi:hypothetical protein